MKNSLLLILIMFICNFAFSQTALSDKDTCMTKKHITKVAKKIVELERKDSLQQAQVKNLKSQIDDYKVFNGAQAEIITHKDAQIEIQADLLTRFSNLPNQPYWWNKQTGFFVGGFFVGGAVVAGLWYISRQ